MSIHGRHGAQRGAGVLVKNAEALELMEKIGTLARSIKTGTLTLGKPRLMQVVTTEGFGEADVPAPCCDARKGQRAPAGCR